MAARVVILQRSGGFLAGLVPGDVIITNFILAQRAHRQIKTGTASKTQKYKGLSKKATCPRGRVAEWPSG